MACYCDLYYTSLKTRMVSVMNSDQPITFFDIASEAKKHYWLAFVCLFLCIYFEARFYVMPPRGVIGEDVILLPSVSGRLLVSFDSLWRRMVNDDELMISIIKQSGIYDNLDASERLAALNGSIRNDLKYEKDSETIVRISFRRNTYKQVRPFLNSLTDKILEKLKALAEEELKSQREEASILKYMIHQRLLFLAEFFVFPEIGIALKEENEYKIAEVFRSVETPDSWWKRFGSMLSGELQLKLFIASSNWRDLTAENLEKLLIYPRQPQQLNSKETLPVPVQPFYQLVYVLTPIAVFIVYLSLLVLLCHFRVSTKRTEQSDLKMS